MIDLSKIKLEVFVSEMVAASYRNGGEPVCRAEFNAIPGKSFIPEQTYITQSVTDNNISYLLTAILDNDKNLFFGGMTGNSFGTNSGEKKIFQFDFRIGQHLCNCKQCRHQVCSKTFDYEESIFECGFGRNIADRSFLLQQGKRFSQRH